MDDDFELPNGSYSVSDIEDYIKNIIKEHEPLTININIFLFIFTSIEFMLD